MDVIDRLHQAVKESGIPKKRIAHLAGMTPSAVSRLLNHRTQAPNVYDVEAIARAIGLSMETLYAQQHDMPAEVEEARAALQTLTVFVERHDPTVVRKPPPVVKKKPLRRARPFPVAATPNVELFEGNDPPRVDVPEELWSSDARHAAKVIGDSMIDAGINSGDIVFFRSAPNIAAARGKIVVCRYGSNTYLKRLELAGNEILLMSDNELYKPIVVGADEDFELYGIVVQPAK